MKSHNIKIFLLVAAILLMICASGCVQESKDDSKYVSLTVYGGFLIKDSGDSFNNYKSEYIRYDDGLFVRVIDMKETLDDGRYVAVELSDYDINQPTEHVIKSSGHVIFNGDSTIASISPNIDMTVRDNTGKIIADDNIKVEIENGETVSFTIQTMI